MHLFIISIYIVTIYLDFKQNGFPFLISENLRNFLFFHWRKIALRCCVGFCHTTMQFSHNFIYIYIYIYTHTHTHTHIYIYIYTYTYINIFTFLEPPPPEIFIGRKCFYITWLVKAAWNAILLPSIIDCVLIWKAEKNLVVKL